MWRLHLARCLALIFCSGFIGVQDAAAYPQFIAKGYTNCASCHYAPDGGAMANAYGVATQQAFLPDGLEVEFLEDLRETMAKNLVTGYDDDDNAAFQWDVGLDSRLLFLMASAEVGSNSDFIVIPMLIEPQLVLAYGPVTAYGSISSRKAGATRSEMTAFSRHHWLQYRVSDELSLRAGRMTQPFGIRHADHTAYTRRDLDFDKYDQTYGVQVDWNTEDWSVAAMGFAGNYLIGDPKVQERGLSATVAYQWTGRATLGLSFLGGMSELSQRLAMGVFTRAKLYGHSYVMAEFDTQFRKSVEGEASQMDLMGILRLGWFPWEWLDVYSETGLKMVPGSSELTRISTIIGTAWKILPWMEIGPYLRILHSSDGGTQFQIIDQLHIVY
jgi:hypothetical protein